ncbi:MAG: 30S ribosomal protein S7 [Candidatus Aenigmatarchaeota archaeon]
MRAKINEKPKKARKIREVIKKEKRVFDVKLFNKWESKGIEVRDISIKNYINLDARILPRTAGKLRKPFHKSNAHIVERLALHMLTPGHTGKKHKVTSGIFGGALYNALKNIEKAFDIIEEKTQKNPIEIFVRAIENAAVKEEIISYQLGSIIAREAVTTAPQRRVDKTLRYMAQGSYRKSRNSKLKFATALANEIMAAAEGKESFAIKEKERIEREAMGAR